MLVARPRERERGGSRADEGRPARLPSTGVALLRKTWQILAGWTTTAVLGLVLIALILVSFGRLGEVVGRPFLRLWGRAMLRFGGVRMVVESGAEHLAGRAPRVVLFNHASTLDDFVVNALLPDGGTPVVKRSMIWVPVIGWVMALGPIVMIDRRPGGRGRATLRRVADRVRRERLSVVIAPEGTRRGGGSPKPFKLGAFDLARESGAPIVPLVILGAEALMPYGRFTSEPGVVRVRILPPIDTAHYTEANLKAEAEALRELYRRELGEARYLGAE